MPYRLEGGGNDAVIGDPTATCASFEHRYVFDRIRDGNVAGARLERRPRFVVVRLRPVAFVSHHRFAILIGILLDP